MKSMIHKNQKLTVLVTATGGPTAIGVLKCLAGKTDISLVGVDIKKNNPGTLYCERFHIVHRMNSAEYLQDIMRIIAEDGIDVIIPTMQDEIEIFHNCNLGVYIALPRTNHFGCLINKHKLYEYLSREFANLIPKYVLYSQNSELENIAQRYFTDDTCFCVKRVEGHGGIDFSVVSSSEEILINAIEKHENIIPLQLFSKTRTNSQMMAMEYIKGTEYSVDVLVHEGKTVVSVPRIRDRVSTGIVIEGSLRKDEDIIRYASSIAEELIESGFINIQFIKNEKEIKLIDLNARFCGSQVHSFGAGVNFPYLLISSEVWNKSIPVDIKWNTTMVRYWESCFYYD